MRENNRKPIENCRKKLPQFTTMNVIDGQAGLAIYSSLIFYSLTIDNILNIIVLLILAAVAINLTIGNNGIFTRAQNATQKWEEASKSEQDEIDKVSNFLDEYMNGNGGGNNNSGTGEGTALGDITGNETTNTVTKDKYGNPITIPAGFKVVNPDDDVTKGIVIEDVSAPSKTADTKGSQFVWIPVGDVYTSSEHTEENKKTITLGRYTFDTTAAETLVQSAENWSEEVAISTSYKELETSSYGNATAKNLESFVTKTLASGGYYIGRYEAGDANATNTERTSSTSDENSIVCKTGVYPYNYVTQSQASSLARGMYTSSTFESDLINSYAWNTAIVFIQKFSGDTNYSRQVGTNTESAPQKCGESTLHSSYVDSGDEAQDLRCNIYDMAGNTYEWTTETYTFTSYPCVNHGGVCYNSHFYTSSRGQRPATEDGDGISFRLILYM